MGGNAQIWWTVLHIFILYLIANIFNLFSVSALPHFYSITLWLKVDFFFLPSYNETKFLTEWRSLWLIWLEKRNHLNGAQCNVIDTMTVTCYFLQGQYPKLLEILAFCVSSVSVMELTINSQDPAVIQNDVISRWNCASSVFLSLAFTFQSLMLCLISKVGIGLFGHQNSKHLIVILLLFFLNHIVSWNSHNLDFTMVFILFLSTFLYPKEEFPTL